ncbi:MAG: hypothetical protein INQ03_19680 [Candidatus Heimdallarchaeota archaeon]|nr:hypothetical protein [Candidatus Heimdallarchaeota archaeon]
MVLDLNTLRSNLQANNYRLLMDNSKLIVGQNNEINKFYMIYTLVFNFPAPDKSVYDRLEILAKQNVARLAPAGKSFGLFNAGEFPDISDSKLNQRIVNIVLLANEIDEYNLGRFNRIWTHHTAPGKSNNETVVISVLLYDRKKDILYTPRKEELGNNYALIGTLKHLEGIFKAPEEIKEAEVIEEVKVAPEREPEPEKSDLMSQLDDLMSTTTRTPISKPATQPVNPPVQAAPIEEQKVDEATFQKILQFYEEIEISDLADLLNVSEKNLKLWLIGLDASYGIKINKNLVIFNQSDIEDNIDALFADFERAEQTGYGKIE